MRKAVAPDRAEDGHEPKAEQLSDQGSREHGRSLEQAAGRRCGVAHPGIVCDGPID
jgi:hypothetical protein